MNQTVAKKFNAVGHIGQNHYNTKEFYVGYPDRYAPEEDWREQQPKCCDNVNSLKSSSQKLRQKLQKNIFISDFL